MRFPEDPEDHGCGGACEQCDPEWWEALRAKEDGRATPEQLAMLDDW